MPQGIVYMEPRQRAQEEKAAQSRVETAKMEAATLAEQIKEARQAATKQKADLYGETLGRMYDGHRNAITFYRDQLSEKWKRGAYHEQPDKFNNDLAQLNAMIEQAEQYYTGTYGTDAANGEGFTFLDGQTRSMLGNSVQFYEDKGLSLGDLDEFDWMQSRYDYVNSGGYDPNTMRINEQGQLVARVIDQQTGVAGDEMPIFDMPHVMAGGKTFMPNLTAIATSTLYDHAMTEDYQNQAQRVQDSLLNAAPSSPVTYYDPTDDSADENGYVTKKAGELTEEQQQIYISDQYFDNHMNTSKFRRMIVDDVFQGITEEQRQQYIDEGKWDGMTDLDLQQARRKWREVSRFSKEEEKPKPPKPPTKDEKERAENRNQLSTAADIRPVPIEETVGGALDGVDFGFVYNEDGSLKKQTNDKKIARNLNEVLVGDELKHISADATTWDGEEIVILRDSETKEEKKFYIDRGREEEEKMREWIKDHSKSKEAPEGHQYTLTAMKNSSVKVTVPDGDGGRVNVEPVDLLFYPSQNKIVITNLFHETGPDKGQPIPDVELKEGDSATASILKQIEDNLRKIYGPDVTLASLMDKTFVQSQEAPASGGSGELD